ncbi:hypothetical protein J4447_00070 [Candidatus Pacearchaeota archaeon]|nr:hypothetical protein [Candidatus Pacearchaeota archaeon]
MVQDYEALVKRISEASGVGEEEIDRRVEAKRAKLSGLISKEGAAQIVATELGISFDKQTVKINQILPGMRRISLTAKIIELSQIREYQKNNRSGKVLNMVIADETGNARCVLWDTNHISLFEGGQIVKGDTVEISNASLRNSEIHLTAFSDIKKSNSLMEEVKTEIVLLEKKVLELKIADRAKVRAVIVQIFEPRFFEVCLDCGSRARQGLEGGFECEKHGSISSDKVSKRAIVNTVLDDGTETIRAVFFSDHAEKLGLSKDASDFSEKRETIIGKEAYFSGSVRQNKMFGNSEFIINGVEEVDLDRLIEKLEKKG